MDCFHSVLDFEHCIREHQDPSQKFAGWHYVEIFAIPSSRRSAFYLASICPEWERFDTHLSLLVLTTPLFSYYSRWIFEDSLCRLIYSVTLYEFVVCAVTQFLQFASSRVTHVFCIDYRVSP